jgi:hypothetical protein
MISCLLGLALCPVDMLGIVPCGHAEVLVLGFHRVVGRDRQLPAREEDTSMYSKSLT